MSFPNLSDIVATTIENRSSEIADNVTKNNAALAYLSKKGNINPISGGGSVILKELSFAENGNGGWYSGYDLLPVAAQDVLSAAQYSWKQYAVPVTISGLEQIQNSGEQRMKDLIKERLKVAEATMKNALGGGVYADGTGSGGKQLAGLGAIVTASPSTGVVGSIDRAAWPFWRNVSTPSTGYTGGSSGTLLGYMNALWAQLVRGQDRPDLILAGSGAWAAYSASLQVLQRFTDPAKASMGFPALEYMGADLVLDGGIGGFAPSAVMYFLNTNYLFLRPSAERNMVPLGKREATNQDATVEILAWAGAFTASNCSLQGYLS